MAKATKTKTEDTEFTLGVADEIPPVQREETASKYDPVFAQAREVAPKAAVVECGERSRATSVAAYLRRTTDEEEYRVEQRLDKVYVLHLG